MAASPEALGPRSRPAWRASLDAFWKWWSTEIGALARERLPGWRGTAVPSVSLDGEWLALVGPAAVAATDSRVDLAALDPARARAEMRALLERAGETRQRVRLCIARDEALVRRVAMPLATEENLEQVLAFEMDRLTPFRAEDVYFDYRVVSRDAAGGKLWVLLAVARRALVDPRIERLRALGANLQGVTVAHDAAAGMPPLDLLPSEQRGERETGRERMVQRSLAAAVLVLFALALFIPLWRKRETVIALQPLVAAARQEAEAANRLGGSLERQVDDYNFLLAKKYATYPALTYVEELTRLLPDNTWLQQLELRSSGKGREVQITGETASSSKLIEILEQSRLLRNAGIRGTVTRGSTPNSERFMIGADALPRPRPEPIPVLQSGAPPPAPGKPAQAVAPKVLPPPANPGPAPAKPAAAGK